MNGGPTGDVFFGPTWPEVEHLWQVPTPTGLKCVKCDRSIQAGEQGIFRKVQRDPFTDWCPEHRMCETSAEE